MERSWPTPPAPDPQSLYLWALEMVKLLRTGEIASPGGNLGDLVAGDVTVDTIELGHPTDTTLARLSAGDMTIEGNRVFRVGGADVPVADGGTGASTAAGARTNLGAVNLAGDTMTGSLAIVAGNATSAIDFFVVQPSDFGADKPQFSLYKGGTANQWNLALFDGTDNGGDINFICGTLSFNGQPVRGQVLLTSGSVSAAATLDIVLSSYTGYRGLKFVLESFIPATDDVDLWMRLSTNAGSSYDATGYSRVGNMQLDSNGTTAPFGFNSSSDTKIIIAGSPTAGQSVSNVAAEAGAHAEVTLYDQTVSQWPRVRAEAVWFGATTTDSFWGSYGGSRETSQDTDAVRFMFESGNITSGKYAVYGLV